MPEKSNGTLVTIMIIIGIIIIILLLKPRIAPVSQYSYQGSLYTASTVPQGYTYHDSYVPSVDIEKTYGHPITVYTYPTTTTQTYTYTVPDQNPYYYTDGYNNDYSSNGYYPNGCTAYTTYSATTGYPCR